MHFHATPCTLNDIATLRPLFLQENNFQIRYNACHERQWSDSWLLSIDGLRVGYGAVKGKDEIKDRNAVFEFYVIPAFRKYQHTLFEIFLKNSGVKFIECQSNDFLLSSLLFEFAFNISADVVLFRESTITDLINPGVTFRRRSTDDPVFPHKVEPVGEYVLSDAEGVVATGGFMLHYNYPFADLYMEVREDKRKLGYGSYLLQEVKKECYLHGRIPAARCPLENIASRACLIKAGMSICGYMLVGVVRK